MCRIVFYNPMRSFKSSTRCFVRIPDNITWLWVNFNAMSLMWPIFPINKALGVKSIRSRVIAGVKFYRFLCRRKNYIILRNYHTLFEFLYGK